LSLDDSIYSFGSALTLLRQQQEATTTDHPPTTGLWITCSTSKGPLNIKLNPNEAPNSVKALLTLVDEQWFSNKIAFFRVNDHAVQFGAVPNDSVKDIISPWDRDPHPEPIKSKRKPGDWIRGDVAMIGGTQMVIVRQNGTQMGMNDLDTVVGRIELEGSMAQVIDRLYAYPDVIHHPTEHGPDQRQIFKDGWSYLDKEFPKVDYIESCKRGYERVHDVVSS
jgi:cyclophilin family peptidyl-prolyl cis-trans isomerase